MSCDKKELIALRTAYTAKVNEYLDRLEQKYSPDSPRFSVSVATKMAGMVLALNIFRTLIDEMLEKKNE